MTNSIPETSAVLDRTQRECTILRARLSHMRTLLADSRQRCLENEELIEEMWKIQWSVDRQYTIIKQLDAACQTHATTEAGMCSAEEECTRSIGEAVAQGARLDIQCSGLRHENDQLCATMGRIVSTCSKQEREKAYEIERVFSSRDLRPLIEYGPGCRFCGYDNGTTEDCNACVASYRTGTDEVEGRKRAIRGILTRVAVDSHTYCSEEHLGRLSLGALRVLCRHLQITY